MENWKSKKTSCHTGCCDESLKYLWQELHVEVSSRLTYKVFTTASQVLQEVLPSRITAIHCTILINNNELIIQKYVEVSLRLVNDLKGHPAVGSQQYNHFKNTSLPKNLCLVTNIIYRETKWILLFPKRQI